MTGIACIIDPLGSGDATPLQPDFAAAIGSDDHVAALLQSMDNSLVPTGLPPSPLLSISRRIRSTPFSQRVKAAGVQGFTVYNHMLLPTVFESLEADYHHLKTQVQLWDVSCERQIEVHGQDAEQLLQSVIPRNLSRMKIGQCAYTPIVDENGRVLNDPVTIKLDHDRFWVSIADSDMALWLKGIAIGGRLSATVSEPDISPLAVQGPKSGQLMRAVFGEEIDNLGFFKTTTITFNGHQLTVSRSGYSKQGGFEIYLTPSSLGEALWDTLMEAGADLGVRAGGPNLIERIEGGLLSYGNDMTAANSLAECGFDKFFNLDDAPSCIGYAALKREQLSGGPLRQLRSLRIAGTRVPACEQPWPIYADGSLVGQVTSAAWSPDLGTNIAIAMVDAPYWTPDTQLSVLATDGHTREGFVGML